jgi:hypothetical protein
MIKLLLNDNDFTLNLVDFLSSGRSMQIFIVTNDSQLRDWEVRNDPR